MIPASTLAIPADYKFHRVDLSHNTAESDEEKELPEREGGAEPCASTHHECLEAMVPPVRLPLAALRACYIWRFMKKLYCVPVNT